VSFRRLLPPLWGFNSELEWRSTSKFEARLLVIGNKFSEHLFKRLDIDLNNKQARSTYIRSDVEPKVVECQKAEKSLKMSTF
jgi:hypothetical protein